MSTSRGDINLVGHNIIFIPEENVGPLPSSIDNIIVKADSPEKRWIEDITQQVGGWRAKLRSTYIRWALSINGLHIAAEKYADSEWAMNHKFVGRSLRPDDDQNINPCVIAEWDGITASNAHYKTIPMLTAFGIIDLYANLEEVIFALYRIYLNYHPQQLLQGNEFRELRRLKREAEADSLKCKAWETAWQKRLNDWQRKKIYDGLGQVFKGFCTTAGIKAPSKYKQTTIETWAESIDIVSFVRNALIHGESIVSEELATRCTKPYACAFDFKSGEPLVIQLYHLQGVDLFCEQLLSALNLSLLELAYQQD